MTTIQQQLDLIATCSQDKVGVTRYSFTREHKQALKIIKSWMLAAGLTVSIDDAGTLIGELKSHNKKAKTLLLGSHQDTVKHGGKYDGIMNDNDTSVNSWSVPAVPPNESVLLATAPTVIPPIVYEAEIPVLSASTFVESSYSTVEIPQETLRFSFTANEIAAASLSISLFAAVLSISDN